MREVPQLIISGGQTGADIAGLRAARRACIRTGGWAPYGYMTERGPRRVLLRDIYGLKQTDSSGYPERTLRNILHADMTLIIADNWDGGSKLTAKLCLRYHKPTMNIGRTDLMTQEGMEEVLVWLRPKSHSIINIAGNRESVSPGIGQEAENFLTALFRSLRVPF